VPPITVVHNPFSDNHNYHYMTFNVLIHIHTCKINAQLLAVHLDIIHVADRHLNGSSSSILTPRLCQMKAVPMSTLSFPVHLHERYLRVNSCAGTHFSSQLIVQKIAGAQ
jgi:hypothetical protein